jgi:hypothetical protein
MVGLGGIKMPDMGKLSDLAHMRWHWGDVYDIDRRPGGKWSAVARWGNHDELAADTPDGLLYLIRRHYGPKTKVYSEAKKLGR